MTRCPCNSKLNYEACCGALIAGATNAKSPEQLMRSRYTAFTQANIEYIMQTMRTEAFADFNAEETRCWAQQVEWLDLEILQTPQVGVGQTIGYVEFIARYREQGVLQQIREYSQFEYDGVHWYYTGRQSATVKQVPHITQVKLGRNESCVCGSGKKYKKCCAI